MEIKCEGIKLQTQAFIGTHYPPYLHLSSQLWMSRGSSDDGLSEGVWLATGYLFTVHENSDVLAH